MGALITPLLITPIALKYGWRFAFVLTGLMGALWVTLWMYVAKPPHILEHRRGQVPLAWPDFRDRRVWVIMSSFGWADLHSALLDI